MYMLDPLNVVGLQRLYPVPRQNINSGEKRNFKCIVPLHIYARSGVNWIWILKKKF
jgi:hypothetical protein